MKMLLIILCPIVCCAQNPSIQNYFEEYNCNCDSYDNESLYEFFGFDVEDDVTPAIEAINSFCKNDQKKTATQGYQTKRSENQYYQLKQSLRLVNTEFT